MVPFTDSLTTDESISEHQSVIYRNVWDISNVRLGSIPTVQSNDLYAGTVIQLDDIYRIFPLQGVFYTVSSSVILSSSLFGFTPSLAMLFSATPSRYIAISLQGENGYTFAG